jgi:DNA-binding MarR family transcriptional regulator
MADIKKADDPLPEAEEIFLAMEALFFAYRDFTREPDSILTRYRFGRAHHRALHFIFRRPGMTVAELLSILAITKQSLNRVLRQLVVQGFVEQCSEAPDRRRRLLYLTPAGEKLIGELSAPQRKRFERAFAEAGASAMAAYHQVLCALADGEAPLPRGRVRRPSPSNPLRPKSAKL